MTGAGQEVRGLDPEVSPEMPETPALAVPTLAESGYEELIEERSAGLVKRFFVTWRHFAGLVGGALLDFVRTRSLAERRGFKFRLAQVASWLVRPLVRADLRHEPVAVQLRRRLEMLGPTYIKLGQILSLREDLLPPAVTGELQNLLSRLPAVPYPRYLELIAEGLGRPVEEMFSWVDPVPTGSASIAQSHRATTVDGDEVILKVVKPGIAQTLRRDARLLYFFGGLLQIVFARFQPKRVLTEFTHYTLREVDLRREADNCETFAANFIDLPDVRFPEIYRQYSGESVLTMEFFDGVRPDGDAVRQLSDADRDRVVDLGVSAIIRMIYRDGFFHADLHPGNLLILPGPQAGFIDLGMVGRLEEEVRRTLLYYYYCLVTGDPTNAARYLVSVADPGPGGDPDGFRRAVEEISRRWQRAASFEGFSLARLILESVALGGKYRVYFPVELVLMTKALITFEGVGHMLKPDFDVAAVSRAHVQRVILHQFSPWRLMRESLRGAPEMIDALVKAPMLVGEGMRLLERSARRPAMDPFAGVRGTIFGGFCMVAAAVLLASPGPDVPELVPGTPALENLLSWSFYALGAWVAPAVLFLIGIVAALNKRS